MAVGEVVGDRVGGDGGGIYRDENLDFCSYFQMAISFYSSKSTKKFPKIGIVRNF